MTSRVEVATRTSSQDMERLSDVRERVKKIVMEHLGADESRVTEDASFLDDLGADSLDFVEVVMALEEEFRCEIPDSVAERILTVQDAITFLGAQRWIDN